MEGPKGGPFLMLCHGIEVLKGKRGTSWRMGQWEGELFTLKKKIYPLYFTFLSSLWVLKMCVYKTVKLGQALGGCKIGLSQSFPLLILFLLTVNVLRAPVNWMILSHIELWNMHWRNCQQWLESPNKGTQFLAYFSMTEKRSIKLLEV